MSIEKSFLFFTLKKPIYLPTTLVRTKCGKNVLSYLRVEIHLEHPNTYKKEGGVDFSVHQLFGVEWLVEKDGIERSILSLTVFLAIPR